MALVVFAFKEGGPTESYVVVCGSNTVIHEDARRFHGVAPATVTHSGTLLAATVESTHFAANAYTLVGNDLEDVRTLVECYRNEPEKEFRSALMGLLQFTLPEWNRTKYRDLPPASLDVQYRELLHLEDDIEETSLDERITAIEKEIPRLGLRISHTRERILLDFPSQHYDYPNPMQVLNRNRTKPKPRSLCLAPGMLSGDNIVVGRSGGAWLTDFSDLGPYPLLWAFQTLEASIRFDWIETNDLLLTVEMERSLAAASFAALETREFEPATRKAAGAIHIIRRLAVKAGEFDIEDYHLGIFYHALLRLADFDPIQPLTSAELARLGRTLVSMSVIAGEFAHAGARTQPANSSRLDSV